MKKCTAPKTRTKDRKTTTGKLPRFPILILLGLAALIRVIYLAFYAANDPLYDLPLSDAAVYDEMARQFAGLQDGDRWSGPFYQAPLFPLLLGILYTLAGRSFLLVYIVQNILGLITLYLIFRIGEKLFDWNAGILAAGLAAFHGTLIFYESKLLPTTLGVFFTTLSVWLLLRAGDTRKAGSWILAGLSLGFTFVARPHLLLVGPLALLWCFFCLRKDRERQSPSPLAAAAILAAGVALPILPFTARNYMQSKEFIPIASDWGINLFIGNNPESKGTNSTPRSMDLGWIETQSRESHRIAEQALGKTLSHSEVSRYWAGRTLDFLRKDPEKFFKNIFTKILLFLQNFEAGAIFVPHAEFHYVPLLAVLRIPYALLLSFGLLGFLLHLRKRGIPLLAAFLLANGASLITFFVISRLRLPTVPLLAVGAGGALILLFREFSRNRDPRTVMPAALLGAGAFFCFLLGGPLLSACLIIPALLLSIFLALLSLRAGQRALPAAAACFTAFFVFSLTNPINGLVSSWTEAYTANALNGIGGIQLWHNRTKEAEKTFLQVLETDPDFTKSLSSLFELYVATGKVAKAEDYLARLKSVDPDYNVPPRIRGLYALRTNRLEDAERLLKKALAKKPEEFDTAFYLGFLYMRTGRSKDAKSIFQKALRTIPKDHAQRPVILKYLDQVERESKE